MKKIKFIVITIFILIFTGCGKPVELSTLQNRQGTYYSINSQKPYSGKFVNYYQNGQIEQEGSLKNGLLDKDYISYYQNGQRRVQSAYKAGVPHGKLVAFYENGEKKCELSYQNGKFEGSNIVYATFFNPKYEVIFKNGRIIKELKYSSNGEVFSVREEGENQFDSEAIEKFFRAQVAFLKLI
ncbi:MAG: toxin-antitoxin system YwqK family antitoxin [Fusobacteriaceae bacterium]